MSISTDPQKINWIWPESIQSSLSTSEKMILKSLTELIIFQQHIICNYSGIACSYES